MKMQITLRWISGLALVSLTLVSCAPAAIAAPADHIPVTPPPTPPVQNQSQVPSADIHLTDQDAGKTIHLKAGQTLAISLEGNPATGYSWEMQAVPNPVLEQVGEPAFEPGSQALGSPGTVTLVFKAIAAGNQPLSLAYHRAWEKDVPPLKTFQVEVIVEGEPAAVTSQAPTAPPAVMQARERVVYPAGGMKGWVAYTSSAYGFTFYYPPEWRLEEVAGADNTLAGHAVWLFPSDRSQARLQIAFKKASDEMPLGRTGLGSGELVDAGSVLLGEQVLSRKVLIESGKHMTVLYRGEPQLGNLVFNFDLDTLGLPGDEKGLAEDVETQADLVVASVQLAAQ